MERRDFHHVNKQEVKVIIETTHFRVAGTIDVLINHSISDELNNNSGFIEVRNAKVIDKTSGQVAKELPEISLGKNCILAVFRSE